jgi:hypothetical protein
VPHLAEYLKNEKDDDRRALARVAITHIGPRAVLPVIELLSHPNRLMAQNAAFILGDITPADHRAIAPLRLMWEDKNLPIELRRPAMRSLEKITGMRVGDMPRTAREYYYLKADRYYRETPSVPLEAEAADGIVWHLSKDETDPKLVARNVKGLYAWNEQMAEEACYDLMALDPEYEFVVPLFASVLAAQYEEVKDLIDISLEAPTTGNRLTDEEILEIRERDSKQVELAFLLHSINAKYLYRAIGKALREGSRATNRDKYAGVITVLADVVKDIDDTGDMLPGGRHVRIGARGRGTYVNRGASIEAGAFEKTPAEKPEGDGSGSDDSTSGDDSKDDATESPAEDGTPAVAEGDAVTVDGDKPAEGDDAGTATNQPGAVGQVTAAGKRAGEGWPLLEALRFRDKRVQYAAAIALAHMNPPRNFPRSGEVVSLLASAIGESGPIQILLIEEDVNVRNAMKGKLKPSITKSPWPTNRSAVWAAPSRSRPRI